VNIFEFTDYRGYLKAFYETKKKTNAAYSMSSFARKAGLGHNSRGYLKLIIEGKRNLTTHTIRRFSEALALQPREALYFENLVYFNQAKTAKDKEYYFQRVTISTAGTESKPFEIMRSQYQFYSNWYYVAVWALASLPDFQETPEWISAQLRGKISRKEAAEALQILTTLGMLRRDPMGRLVPSDPLVRHPGGFFTKISQKFHIEMMERAKEAMLEDEYEERNASGLTLSCERALMPQIKLAIDDFRDDLNLKFGIPTSKADSVIQCNFQIFQITPPKKGKPRKNQERKDQEQPQ
jgi:uncharacterized protein (TIGR02147 family)